MSSLDANNSVCGSRDSFNDSVPIQQHQQQIYSIISYLKFYHFSRIDGKFYLVSCKIIPKEDTSFDEFGYFNHEFFYQHPNYPSTQYYVACRLLSHSLVENILNNEFCDLEFDLESLSIPQKLKLEHDLKQKLFHRMHNLTFYDAPQQPIDFNNFSYHQNNFTNNSI
ncbi:hypothetical protein RclHR1_01300011 [Rhizophagus clarus]|uniref:Uncharacterized protein n=1 Tax=Rhizophagus clarus TaxID=94130 RepID=A0A2Z6R1P0_9GLOM|nr:hypothetical protein RclHR1_01300011 [Rhizophagus clarus]GES95693.1 hypothetical protein GLOIN_2v1510446 [Rhizophagus clarus]